jgi:hypothetical protein
MELLHKGFWLNLETTTNNTTISIGRLASLKEGTLNDLKFKSEYLAIKTGSKYKKLNYEFGLFSCLKDMPQGNQFFCYSLWYIFYHKHKGNNNRRGILQIPLITV